MWRILLLLALMLPTTALAQVSYPPSGVTPDMIPVPGTEVPRSEIVGGANNASLDPKQYAPMMHQHPRISRSGVLTATTGGVVSVVWADPLPPGAPSYPVFFTGIGANTSSPPSCVVTASSNTGFTATCRRSLLNIALLGPIVEVLPTGGQVFALQLPATQPTQ